MGELIPEATEKNKGLMSISSYKNIEIAVDLRGYKLMCICKTSNIWFPIEPILIILKNGIICIFGGINDNVNSNYVSCRRIIGDTNNFKIYKRIEDGFLKIFIYCNENKNSPQLIWIKRKYMIEESIETSDLSNYTEVPFS